MKAIGSRMKRMAQKGSLTPFRFTTKRVIHGFNDASGFRRFCCSTFSSLHTSMQAEGVSLFFHGCCSVVGFACRQAGHLGPPAHAGG